jgi:hypothetical protein
MVSLVLDQLVASNVRVDRRFSLRLVARQS